MKEMLSALLKKRPVVLDGAWGTQLQSRGLPAGACPDEWNLSHPEKVKGVAREYIEAGSRIIGTNTFGANSVCLEKSNLADRAREINLAGIAISKRAAGERALVFASMGPTGKSLLMKEIDPERVARSFREQAEALASGGADGLVVETMMDLQEAELAVQAAKSTGLPVVACMTYGAGKDKDRTLMGVSIAQAVERFVALGVDIVGSNCGQGLEGMLRTCKVLKEQTDLPIWIEANAGIPRYKEGKTVYDTDAERFVELAQKVVEAGADLIGGCCGTDPEYIRLIAERYDR